jgi:ribonuclease VapC
MVIDTSAIITILANEPDRDAYINAIVADSKRLVSSVSALEAALVIESRYGEKGGMELDLFLHQIGADVVSMDREQYEIARQAWRKYGKGNAPAALNMGDCCSYALSVHSGEPLLFKGRDFSRTDVRSALG